MTASSEPGPGASRRGFLDWLLGICSAITAAAAAVPALIYLWPVTKKGPGADRHEIVGAGELEPWDAKTDTMAGKPVIVLRAGDKFVAYSAVCTHLGCIVHWDKQKKAFLCPCHAAVFDVDGKVLDGPPPAPLRPYNVSAAGGKVYICEAQAS